MYLLVLFLSRTGVVVLGGYWVVQRLLFFVLNEIGSDWLVVAIFLRFRGAILRKFFLVELIYVRKFAKNRL